MLASPPVAARHVMSGHGHSFLQLVLDVCAGLFYPYIHQGVTNNLQQLLRC